MALLYTLSKKAESQSLKDPVSGTDDLISDMLVFHYNLDRIYRNYRIFSQFPDETEK
jgi:hypothetical protein